MKDSVFRTKSSSTPSKGGEINPAFETADANGTSLNLSEHMDGSEEQCKRYKSPVTAKSLSAPLPILKNAEELCKRAVTNPGLCRQGDNECLLSDCQVFLENDPTHENLTNSASGDDAHSRHANGHVLLGNSVSSYIEGNLDSRNAPLTQKDSLNSDQGSSCFHLYPRRSRNSSESHHGDSGVCSEATSGAESFFNVHGDICVNCRHCGAPCVVSGHSSEDKPQIKHPNSGIVSDDSAMKQDDGITQSSPTSDNTGNGSVIVDIDGPSLSNKNLQTATSDCSKSLSDLNVCLHSENHDSDHQHHLYKKHNIHGKESHHFRDKIHPFPTISSENKDNQKKAPKKKDNNIPSEPFLSKYTSCRWKLAYLCFLARFIQTALRQCMGIAIVGMTTQVGLFESSNSTNSSSNVTAPNATEMTQEFEWSSGFEGLILASFNMGSIITPIIVGYLTTRYGGRKLMTVCLVGGGLFTLLLPIGAKAHVSLIIVFRIVTGMALSGTDSLIQAMLARWAPHYEKASLSSCAYTGLSVAGVLTFLVCGYLASIGGEGKGWPYIFYLFGALCLLLAPVWYFVVYDGPEKHPRITKKEKAIIMFNKETQTQNTNKQPLNTPWRRILKSPAVWVIMMGHITHKWILSFMLSYLPRYFEDLFEFSMEMDGLISSLPFVGRIISGIIAGYLSDWMLLKGVTTQRTRKVFQAAGCWGCAVCSLFIACIPSMSAGWSISLLVLALSFQNLTSVAFRINLLDIAPRYAGLLNGFVSTIATVISLPAPVLTSLLISGGSRQGWSVVFYLVAALNIIGGLIFVLFAKGEVQDWAKSKYEEKPTEASEVDMDTGVSYINCDAGPTTYRLVNGKVLREVKSFPASTRRQSGKQKQKIGRRATLDVGSLIKRVQSDAFTNLALADL